MKIEEIHLDINSIYSPNMCNFLNKNKDVSFFKVSGANWELREQIRSFKQDNFEIFVNSLENQTCIMAVPNPDARAKLVIFLATLD